MVKAMDGMSKLTLSFVLDYVVQYCTLSDLARISLTSKASLSWVLNAVNKAGKITYDITNDEECTCERVQRILLATEQKRIVLGGEVTDVGCERLREIFALLSGEVVELDASNCTAITQEGLDALFSASQAFSALSLASLWRVGDDTLRLTLKQASGGRLRSLDVSRCYRLTDVAARELRGLRHLNLERCVSIFQPETLALIASNNPDLVELNLAGVSAIVTDAALQACPQLRSLERLNLEGAHEMSDLALFEIARICPKLKSLCLARCVGLTRLDGLVKTLGRSLNSLDVSGCHVFGQGDDEQALSGLTRLTELDARQSNFDRRAMASAGHITTLRKLVLTGCTQLDDSAFVMNQSCRLEDVALGSCEGVGDLGVASLLGRHGGTLKQLQLPRSSSDFTLGLVADLAARIETLDMGKAPNITDAGALLVAAKCGNTLRHLRVDETSITDAFLSLLPFHAAKLEKLTGYGCNKASLEGFATLDCMANAQLRTLMDREGRMLRCSCCPCRKSQSSCLSPGATAAYPMSLAAGKDSARFFSMEAPMIAISCLAIAVDWFFS